MKPFAELLQPDRRFHGVVLIDPKTNIARPMELSDLYGLVEPSALIPSVSDDVRAQMDAARHAFV